MLFLLFLFNVDVNYSYIYLENYSSSLNFIDKKMLKYNYFGSCALFVSTFRVINDSWVASVIDPY